MGQGPCLGARRGLVEGGNGGSRNDPRRIRCGCFLPDLTGLAKTTSARLPRRIWRGERENARPAIRHAGLDPAPAFLASKEAGPDRVRSDERNQRGPCMLRLSEDRKSGV